MLDLRASEQEHSSEKTRASASNLNFCARGVCGVHKKCSENVQNLFQLSFCCSERLPFFHVHGHVPSYSDNKYRGRSHRRRVNCKSDAVSVDDVVSNKNRATTIYWCCVKTLSL